MIFKIISFAIITAILCIYFKNINSDFFILVLISGGVVISLFTVSYLSETLVFFKSLTELTGVDNGMVVLCAKVTLIGYLVEFACGTIEDCGLKGLSDKVAFVGRLVILGMSIPLFSSLIKMITVFLDKL